MRGVQRLAPILVLVLAVPALVIAAGAIYQSLASAREWQLYRPPGKMVDIGGRQLHIFCIGQGNPAVILEAGLGDPSLYWFLVKPEIAKFTRVCSYDRAGLGWSDADTEPRTADRITSDLDALLVRAAVPPPYILVGHSLGGYLARIYALKHPQKVIGLVFVDSTGKDQYRRLVTFLRKDWEEDDRLLRRSIVTLPVGLPRIMGWCRDAVEVDSDVLKPLLPELIALYCRKARMETTRAEWDGFRNADREVDSLGSLPVVVVSHDPAKWNSPPYDARAQIIWDQMQEELKNLSSNSTQVVAKGSGHHIQVDRPLLVIQAINTVYNSSKNHTPVAQLGDPGWP